MKAGAKQWTVKIQIQCNEGSSWMNICDLGGQVNNITRVCNSLGGKTTVLDLELIDPYI